MTMMKEFMIQTKMGFWVELDKQGPRFSIRMVIGIYCFDTVQLNQYSQILRRQCCLELDSNEIGLIKEGVT